VNFQGDFGFVLPKFVVLKAFLCVKEFVNVFLVSGDFTSLTKVLWWLPRNTRSFPSNSSQSSAPLQAVYTFYQVLYVRQEGVDYPLKLLCKVVCSLHSRHISNKNSSLLTTSSAPKSPTIAILVQNISHEIDQISPYFSYC